MIRIFIADNHVGVREGVKRILGDTTDMCVAGEASNVTELLVRIAKNTCDVVLLDSTLPGQDGLDVLPCFKQTYPRLPVLVCSTYVGSRYVTEAFKAGAAGYITKDRLAEDLVQAIRQVEQGRRYVSPLLANLLDWDEPTEG
jgi:DNA-binding NarL/FixJ family response regulator